MIDWSRIDELVDEIGAEDFGEIVDLFLDEVEGAIATFESGGVEPGGVEEQMHFLKGAALNLGFESLAQLCLKGEKSAAAGNPDTVSVAQVRSTFEESRTQFLAKLPARIAA